MSDIVSFLDLSTYPQVALVIFLGVFVGVLWRVLDRTRAAELESHGRMPLEDGSNFQR